MRRRHPRGENPYRACLEAVACTDPDWLPLAEVAEQLDSGSGAALGTAWLGWPGRERWLVRSGAFRWTAA
jgi:hypothetical protein